MDKSEFSVKYYSWYDYYYISDGRNNYLHTDLVLREEITNTGKYKTKQEAEDTLRKWKMARLTCSDGTVINISAETEAELRKAFGNNLPNKIRCGDMVRINHSGTSHTMLVACTHAGNIGLTCFEPDKGKDYTCTSSWYFDKNFETMTDMTEYLRTLDVKYLGHVRDLYVRKNL